MTRERLLKVARRKSVDVQEKVYANLRQKLEKSENTSIKSTAKSQGTKKVGNRFVNAQIRKIESMAVELNASHEKMFSKIKAELTDEDKQGLIMALEGMRADIDVLLNSFESAQNLSNSENCMKFEDVDANVSL